MPIYNLSVDTATQKKQKLMKLLPIIGLAALPALIFGFIASRDMPYVFPFMVLVMCIATIIGITLGIKRQSSTKLILENDQVIYQRQGRAEVRIKREDIKRIIETSDSGLRIKSIDPTDEIFVTKDFQNYDQLKIELGYWLPIETPVHRKYPFNLFVSWIIIMVVLIIAAFVFRIRIFFYLWIASLALPVVYQYALNFKSMIVTKDPKKRIQIIISFVLIVYIIYKLFLSVFFK